MSIPKVLVFLMALLPVSCLAQITITGRVLNQVNGKPVANASVFLSNATTGGKTADDGTFTLHNAKPGRYTMVISCIGFEALSQAVLVPNKNVDLADVMISPKSIGLKGVTIKPQDEPFRSNYYFLFKERFLGNSDLAKQCKILNPEILDFNYDNVTKILTASSPDFLEIENDALGYKVKYLLTNFTWDNSDSLDQKMKYEGPVLFEPMKGSVSQQRRWQRARRNVYEGSEMHFFRSVIASRIDNEGFKLLRLSIYANPERSSDSLINTKIKYFRGKKTTSSRWRDSVNYWTKMLSAPKIFNQLIDIPLNKGDIIRPTDQRGLYALGCEFDGLYVIYNHDRKFPENPKKISLYNPHHVYNPNDLQASLISFNEPFAFIDRNGMLANPYSITINGRWSYNRVPELLPSDYEPDEKENVPVDSTVSKHVLAELNSFSGGTNTEKVYLHFDKPYYVAGDTMYFKAYITSGERHQLSGLSGVLHVDLVDANNKIDQAINLKISDGLTWGDFALPDSLPKGGYRVRAYTRLALNDGEAGFFDQIIPVGSALVHKISQSSLSNRSVSNSKPDIQLFPEGGELVTDVRSKVAFKAISADGSGIHVKGVVIDNDNKEVTTLQSTHLGMGYFYLSPLEGKTYKIKLTYSDGTQSTIDIPKANENGIVISVNNDSLMEASIKIEASAACYKANRNKDYTVVIYSGGTAKAIILKLDNPVVTSGVVKRQLKSGIARVTLFSPAGEPLSERLFFIRNDDQLDLTVNSDEVTYSKKEKVNVRLYSSDNGDPAAGHFSVSVIDESKVPVNENAENTILTNLLLTSDLKGYVEQPNYYFTDENDRTRSDLDLVMLTHGYRRFEWKEVLDTTQLKTHYQPENSLELAGTIKTRSGKPLPHGSITLLSTKENVARDTTADVNGEFKFMDIYLSDTAKIVLNARKSVNGSGNVKLELKAPDYPPIEKMNILQSDTSAFSKLVAESIKKQYDRKKNLRNGIFLKQVDIKSFATPTIRPELKHSSNLNGPGQADYVIYSDKLGNCANLLDCLVGKIHGVRYLGFPPTIYSVRTTIAMVRKTSPMAIILDGVVDDQSILASINPSDVASIEILESPIYLAVYGSSVSGGALIINTKVGSEVTSTTELEPGMITYRFNGFHKAREFYSPQYNHLVTDSTIPDLRTTIYWKPEVTTDKDGNASFEYYNADTPGYYRVVVEGIDENGNIGRQVYRYKVQ